MPACPKCGEENPERARFCWSCGATIAETPRSGAEERKIPALAVAAFVEQARGDLSAAEGFVEEIEQTTRGMSDFHRGRFLHELAIVCVEAGDLDLIRKLVDSIRITAGRVGHSLVGARAVLAEADGDPKAARSSCSRRLGNVGVNTGSCSAGDWHWSVRHGACLPSGVGPKQARCCIKRVTFSPP